MEVEAYSAEGKELCVCAFYITQRRTYGVDAYVVGSEECRGGGVGEAWDQKSRVKGPRGKGEGSGSRAQGSKGPRVKGQGSKGQGSRVKGEGFWVYG